MTISYIIAGGYKYRVRKVDGDYAYLTKPHGNTLYLLPRLAYDQFLATNRTQYCPITRGLKWHN